MGHASLTDFCSLSQGQAPFSAVISVLAIRGAGEWRHGWMQHVYMMWRHGPGNIWPIAIVFWALALLPFVALAKLATSISGYKKRKASDRKVEIV
jgi:hypothetical protein